MNLIRTLYHSWSAALLGGSGGGLDIPKESISDTVPREGKPYTARSARDTLTPIEESYLRVLKFYLTHFRYKTLPPPPPLLPTTTTLDFEKARPYSARSVLKRSGILIPNDESNLRDYVL